ncbi:unnamed protein product [marine sediment metagenome]|uniref:Uncharacterized protein n=1 Tax=marine sediment metagenome TaxID=412755 RepID=X1V8N9_9ZZZZ
MKKQKNYDKKVKQTRILLSDYLLLKGYAQEAGVSMSEALHTIITRDWAMAKRKAEPVAVATKPAIRVKAPVALPVTAPVALRHGSPVSIATNGSKIPAFRIKHKGARYD